MAGASNIEWTDATWNPIVGCSIVSPGCTNCYAMAMAHRINKMTPSSHYEGTTKKVNGKAVWTGKLSCAPDFIFTAPLRRRKPTTYFVNSMGDLFHEDCPDELIDRVFAVMRESPQHTFQVLTKRAERMRTYVTERREHEIGRAQDKQILGAWPVPVLPNVWLGVSAERQQEADERIPLLLQTPAAIRFVSLEPLLGPIDLTRVVRDPENPEGNAVVNSLTGEVSRFNGRWTPTGKLDWVIVGGESGPNARPMHPQWALDLRKQCEAADIAYFFKQWGGWAPHTLVAGGDLGGDVRVGRVRIVHPTGQSDVEVSVATGGRSTIPGSRYMANVGKKAAGRLLDGKEHNGMPSVSLRPLPSGLPATSNKSSDEVSA